MDLLGTLGAEVSVALENARLYHELKRSQDIIRSADRLSALGTLAAVVTSLVLAYLAWRADRIRLRAYADAGIFPGSDKHGVTRCLRVTIANVEKSPFRVRDSCFYWRMPFSRHRVQMPIPDSLFFAERERYPLLVAPRTSDNIWPTYWGAFEQMVEKMRKAPTFADRIRFRFIKAFVRTDDGYTFRVKIAPEVREVWSGGGRYAHR